MADQKPSQDWLKRRTITVFGLVVFGYLLFGSGKLIFENYRIHQNDKQLQGDIAKLEQYNLELRSLLAYYRTDAYKEKEARARLGFQKPGERLVVVPVPPGEVEQPTITEPGVETQSPTPPSNPKQWLDYFLARRA